MFTWHFIPEWRGDFTLEWSLKQNLTMVLLPVSMFLHIGLSMHLTHNIKKVQRTLNHRTYFLLVVKAHDGIETGGMEKRNKEFSTVYVLPNYCTTCVD